MKQKLILDPIYEMIKIQQFIHILKYSALPFMSDSTSDRI